MKKRILHILNWDKYQARSDKELPWLKLWGRLFKAPWFQALQDDEKFVTIALLDLARQFNNNIPEEMIFKDYLRGNYGIFMNHLRIAKLSQVLVSNDFLSDNCPTFVEVEGDKIRVDKIKTRQGGIGFVPVFEELWIKYPNKDGKKLSLRAFNTSVSTEQDIADIRLALENYLKSDKVKKGFIKNGSTWFNNWRDWVVPPISEANSDVPESLRRFVK